MASQAQLDEAKAALHSLLIGRQAVKITNRDGQAVEYQQSDIDSLKAYITTLETELGKTTNRRGPAGVR